MRLRISLPSRIFLDTDVQKVVAESLAGSFGLLPRHIDMATALAPGILAYTDEAGQEQFLAVSEGILVKKADEVLVSVRTAVSGQLGELRDKVRRFAQERGEREQVTRTAVAHMEADFVRRFLEFQHG
ncbi:MAG: F0F1 ATP synthase subunit epsilon [Desulfocurvibacter africanus]